jgi:hypothetical protein
VGGTDSAYEWAGTAVHSTARNGARNGYISVALRILWIFFFELCLTFGWGFQQAGWWVGEDRWRWGDGGKTRGRGEGKGGIASLLSFSSFRGSGSRSWEGFIWKWEWEWESYRLVEMDRFTRIFSWGSVIFGDFPLLFALFGLFPSTFWLEWGIHALSEKNQKIQSKLWMVF